ncbi:MAG: adenylate/guanylate cyclase domain-containing protein [Dongiaceae bacterium]
MDKSQLADIAIAITESGLAGRPESVLVAELCGRAVAAGLPLARAAVIVDTLHPIYEGRVFRWQRDAGETTTVEYGRSDVGEALDRWRSSTFYRLQASGDPFLHRRLTADTDREFSIFAELREAGMTGYLALVTPFASEGTIGEMECVYSSWVTDAPEGFAEAHLGALQRLVPFFALAVKSTSLARIAGTLVETYLGRDAGRRVLSGRIARGVADQIEAVLWFSDLRGYTRITDTADPTHIIPLLNDYAGAVISAIHEQGGDVLKLMGDGTLAIFTGEDRGGACRAALAAAGLAKRNVAALNERRAVDGLPTTEIYLGLHLGDVFYGNIGSEARLDFTVVGPAVNEVSRIAALCRSVEQPLLLSSAFAAAVGGDAGERLVSVGRYALRGVGRPQDLFTLDL